MQKRIRIIRFIFLLGCLTLISRLYYWQIIRHNDLRAIGDYQYAAVGRQISSRGLIHSKDGYPLVQNKEIYTLIADPQQLEMTERDLQIALRKIIGQDFFIKPYSRGSRWAVLALRLDQNVKMAIESLKIKGLSFETVQSRYYPEASMSAHLLGFVGNDDGGQLKGYYGIEGYYDRELRGRSVAYVYQRDAVFRPIDTNNNPPISLEGRSLITSIDRLLQYQLDKRLADGVAEYQAKSGFGLILDPRDGSVLAMSAWPTYEPSRYWIYNPELYRNPLVSQTYEPGSIFKVLVMASALNEGIITPDSICDKCSGPRNIDGYSIKTWNEKYYPNTTAGDILVHSDNVGMVFISEKLGIKTFLNYYRLMGFEQNTGIDLEGEITPPVRLANEWKAIDLATASFGQGIAVSPIQITSAVNAIASGGIIYQPYVVKEAVENGKHLVLNQPNGHRIFLPKTTTELTRLMVNSVELGEAKWAKPKGYSIAGKTGTAQIPIAGHYDPEKTVASFIGFAPADRPRFTMLISLIEPKISTWGSETAAPLWFKVAADIFRLWGIPPDS